MNKTLQWAREQQYVEVAYFTPSDMSIFLIDGLLEGPNAILHPSKIMGGGGAGGPDPCYLWVCLSINNKLAREDRWISEIHKA